MNRITAKKQKLDSFRPLPPELVKNLEEWFRVELTYTSNAIEGNTLSRQQTAAIVEKGVTVEGKTLREHLEATNHAQAFDWVKTQVAQTRLEIDEKKILELHRLILQKIDDTSAGRYRTVAVRIAGTNVILPNPAKVPQLMQEFVSWLGTTRKLHPAIFAADAHFKLVSIHPFVDGNGRTARLLMNLLLMQQGYPPAIVSKEDRRKYLEAIEKGQMGGSLGNYYLIIYQAIEKSLDLYLDSIAKSNPTVVPPKVSP